MSLGLSLVRQMPFLAEWDHSAAQGGLGLL